MHKDRVYFPGLNGLRLFAALIVVINHSEQTKNLKGLANIFNTSFKSFGGHAVTLFFVLSGFLITYLLFTEQEVTVDISVKKFYARRFLRIWPLYFTIVLTGIFILPHIPMFAPHGAINGFDKQFLIQCLLFIFILPNVHLAIFTPAHLVTHTWSIGVEEQFYLVWPALIKFFRNKLAVILVVIFLFPCLKLGLAVADKYVFHGHSMKLYINWIGRFLDFTRIDCMGIGALGAYFLFFNKEKWLKIIFHPIVQVFALGGVAAMAVVGFAIPIFTHDCFAIFFCVIILNVAANDKRLFKLEHPFLNFGGKISYGIYMYHFIGIYISFAIMKSLLGIEPNSIATNIIYYALTIGITMGIASLSYRYFESIFLKMKMKFTRVLSGEEAREK